MSEVGALKEDAGLYRSVGKMFLKQTKPEAQELLAKQAATGTDRISALMSRQGVLERNVSNMTNELKAMQETAMA